MTCIISYQHHLWRFRDFPKSSTRRQTRNVPFNHRCCLIWNRQSYSEIYSAEFTATNDHETESLVEEEAADEVEDIQREIQTDIYRKLCMPPIYFLRIHQAQKALPKELKEKNHRAR